MCHHFSRIYLKINTNSKNHFKLQSLDVSSIFIITIQYYRSKYIKLNTYSDIYKIIGYLFSMLLIYLTT